MRAGFFMAYDVRGVYGQDINERVFEQIGKAFGTFLAKKRIRECFIARDNRPSSNSLKKSFSFGLASAGISARDLGIASNPIAFYAMLCNPSTGGAIVTASHNPSEYNGVKFYYNNSQLKPGEVEQVKKNFLEKNLVQRLPQQ